MRLILCIGWLLGSALAGRAAERFIDFGAFKPNQPPPGFRSVVSGEGKPGDWQVVLEDVPPALAPLSPNATAVIKRAVLGQLARDPRDEHFPLLILDDEVFADFSLTTRFKTVAGTVEQMAGIAFRIQDEKNYYIVRASSLGNNIRFYKFVNGGRTEPIGPAVEIPSGVWYELGVECKGTQIRVKLNGKEIMPVISDSSFGRGKIGYWTKSDSVSYFVDTKIDYKPIESLATVIVRDTMQHYSRLLGIRMYGTTEQRNDLHIIAASDPKLVGSPAEKLEQDVLAKDGVAWGKNSENVVVTLPLHDRNGEAIAVVRVTMKTFPGQTENNAIGRAMPIVKSMEARVRTAKELTE